VQSVAREYGFRALLHVCAAAAATLTSCKDTHLLLVAVRVDTITVERKFEKQCWGAQIINGFRMIILGAFFYALLLIEKGEMVMQKTQNKKQ
jgi:hypothetical protein